MIKLKKITKIYKTQSNIVKAINLLKKQDSNTNRGIKALDNVSFFVNDSEIIGLIGPNGAGKTTAAKIISGLLFPTSGTVKVDDENPLNLSKSFKLNFALHRSDVYMLDDNVIIRDAINSHLSIYSKPDIQNNDFLKNLIEILDAKDLLNRIPNELSKGQRTLMEFLNAISHEPKNIILDEPMNGLDILAIQRFNSALTYLKQNCTASIIITSHNLDTISKISDRIILINKGKVMLDGTTLEILKKETGIRIITITLDNLNNNLKFENLKQYGEVTIDKNIINIKTKKKNIKSLLKEIINNYQITDLTINEPPIEEIFAKYYKK